MSIALKKFQELLTKNLPECKIAVDAPANADGYWFIEVRAGKRGLTFDYRPRRGFGLHDKGAGFGEGPAEIYRTPELAARRAVHAIGAGKGKLRRLTLKDVRHLYGCSQVDLAEKVGVKQSAISRFEKRDEVKLGTLAAAIKAMGGELEIRARFEDADLPLSIKE